MYLFFFFIKIHTQVTLDYCVRSLSILTSKANSWQMATWRDENSAFRLMHPSAIKIIMLLLVGHIRVGTYYADMRKVHDKTDIKF